MAKQIICNIDGCGKKAHNGGGMCSMHQARVRIHGSPHLGAFRPKGTCTVSGCASMHYGRGFCVKHYKRWVKYGDPLMGGTEWGAAQRFVKDAASAKADDCIIYPFYRNKEGYGWMRVDGRNIGSHVYVAILAHGPKPSPRHEACHTCGRGHDGCVNPRHIYWGTRSDNLRDSYRQGRNIDFQRGRGEAAAASRYSDDQIAMIRVAIESGERQTAIATRFGISQSHVSRIKHGARTTP